MANRDYIHINNYSNLGQLGISRRAIAKIVENSVTEVSGARIRSRKRNAVDELFSVSKAVGITLTREGKAKVALEVAVSLGQDVNAICIALQKKIADNLSMMIDALPYEIQVKVAKIAA